jgi:FAD binding domain
MTPASKATPTRTADVIVVGSGPGGLSAAVYAHRLGEKVAHGCGVLPGPKPNGLIRERGVRDAKESTLRFLARSARPSATTPQTRT